MGLIGGNRRLVAAALLVLAMVVGGCSSEVDEQLEAGGQPGGSDTPLFVSIEVAGGFVPRGADFRQPPSAVIYRDGRAFSPGAITLQFPGPAVLPVLDGQLTEGQMDEILASAQDSGLADNEEQDYGEPMVADAGTTTITVVLNGETYVTSVYALGFPSGPPEAEAAPGESGAPGEPESDPDQAGSQNGFGDTEARRQAAAFVELVNNAVTKSQGEQLVVDRYRVLPFADEPGSAPSPEEGGIEPQVKDWPFPDVALTNNECVAIVGERASQFGQDLAEANQITRWRTASGELFELAVRPTLPHEPDCPDPDAPKPQDPYSSGPGGG